MDSSLQQFAHAVDNELHLDRAALLIGQWDHPEQSLTPYLAQLDALAQRAQANIDGGQRGAQPMGPIDRAKAISATLFDEHGFRGNQDDYYDPRNSFLTCVLDRKVGLPITLGVLYLEIARRVGVLAQGVNFPGHFIVRVAVDDAWLFVDTFDRGKALAPSDLEALAKRFVGPDAKLEPRLMAAASKRQILTRMLTNLAGVYGKSGDIERSVEVLERMAIVDPSNDRLIRELGNLRNRLQMLN
jgi:regulator of sirC expression with transglutaminase-like and TPR domain